MIFLSIPPPAIIHIIFISNISSHFFPISFFFTILKTKLSFAFPRSHLLSSGPKHVQSAGAFFVVGTSIDISFETFLSKLFLHRRFLGASLVSRSSTLRAVQPRLLRKPRSRRVPRITTVEEGPSLACTSLPPASRGHYCSTQHLHLGFFFRVTCSTCDASPGPCAVILATSTVAVLDDAATFSLTGC